MEAYCKAINLQVSTPLDKGVFFCVAVLKMDVLMLPFDHLKYFISNFTGLPNNGCYLNPVVTAGLVAAQCTKMTLTVTENFWLVTADWQFLVE